MIINNNKINLMIAVAGLNIGGAEVVIKHLVKAIDRQRFYVIVCCIKVCGTIGDELAKEGVEIYTLSRAGEHKVDYFTFVKMMRLIRDKRIDVVHSHTADALADAAVCKLMIPRLKLVHTFHYGNYPNLKWRSMWIEHVFSRLANRLIAVGEVQRQQIRQVFHFPEGRIARVWNGISYSIDKRDDSFRTKVGADDQILIGTIATLIEQKGLFDLLAVAKQMRDAGKRVRFVVVGDGHLRQALVARRKELGLEDTVYFTGWVMDAAEVVLPAIDIFFQPSLWEAMSIVILEAMAAGKAIVATRVGENSHIIEDGIDGILVDSKDVKGMTAALCRLIDDEKLRLCLGIAAAKKVSQQFTTEHMTEAYEEVYKNICNSR